MSANKDTIIPEDTSMDDAVSFPTRVSRRSLCDTVKVWQVPLKLTSLQSTAAVRQNRLPGFEVVPLGHGVGLTLPGEPQKVPAGHAVQEAVPADAYVPAEH
jgi:hypothetical protein